MFSISPFLACRRTQTARAVVIVLCSFLDVRSVLFSNRVGTYGLYMSFGQHVMLFSLYT